MGSEYYASAVIGVEINQETLYATRRRRGCDHRVESSHRFCPYCGKPVWIGEDRLLVACLPKDLATHAGVEFVGDLPVFHTTDGRRTFVGYGTTTGSSNGGSDVNRLLVDVGDGMAAAARKIKNTLEPLGLWDETRFGLWAVLRCSY